MAVTGLLFVSVVLVINGKQASTEFQTAIRDVQSQVQQIINQTASGYFTDSNLTCTASGSSVTVTAAAPQPDQQGQCEFLGQALHFTNDPATNNVFTVIPIVGQNNDVTTQSNVSFSSAVPVLLAATSASNPPLNPPAPASVDATTTDDLEYGLNVTSMYYLDSSGAKQSIGSIAFAQSLGSISSAGGGQAGVDLIVPLRGQSQTSDLSRPNDTNGVITEAGNLDDLFLDQNGFSDSSADSTTNAYICFSSATTNQSGLLSFSNNNDNLAAQVQIFGGGDCT